MNSRVIDAYHLHDTVVYLQQKRLLKQYKVLVFVFSFTFELFIFSEIFLFNIYAIFDTICYNFCCFNVNYHIPMLTISESSQTTLLQISYFFLIFPHWTTLLVYVNFIVVNMNFIFVITRKYLKRKLIKIKYHYRVCSDPLLP